MRNFSTLASAFVIGWFLTGCTATSIAYDTSNKISDKEASALFVDLTLSQQASSSKPASLELRESSILWEKDPMYFISMKNAELLQKSGKYQVQINFHGHVFRKDNWFIAYRTADIDEAKRYIDVMNSLIAARNSASRCGGTETPGKTVATPASQPVTSPIN